MVKDHAKDVTNQYHFAPKNMILNIITFPMFFTFVRKKCLQRQEQTEKLIESIAWFTWSANLALQSLL